MWNKIKRSFHEWNIPQTFAIGILENGDRMMGEKRKSIPAAPKNFKVLGNPNPNLSNRASDWISLSKSLFSEKTGKMGVYKGVGLSGARNE